MASQRYEEATIDVRDLQRELDLSDSQLEVARDAIHRASYAHWKDLIEEQTQIIREAERKRTFYCDCVRRYLLPRDEGLELVIDELEDQWLRERVVREKLRRVRRTVDAVEYF